MTSGDFFLSRLGRRHFLVRCNQDGPAVYTVGGMTAGEIVEALRSQEHRHPIPENVEEIRDWLHEACVEANRFPATGPPWWAPLVAVILVPALLALALMILIDMVDQAQHVYEVLTR